MKGVSVAFKRAVAGLSVAACLLVIAEGALRIIGVGPPVRPRIILRLLDSDVTLPYVREDLKLFWSPLPGYQGVFMGKAVAINSLGLRGDEVVASRTPGVARIVCFGDSITFGFGVNQAETYPVALRNALGMAEVVNAGVTGYSSHQALGMAHRLLPMLHPDIAALLIGWNDGNHRPVDDREYARRIELVHRLEEPLQRIYLYRALTNFYLSLVVTGDLSRAKGTPKHPRVSISQYEENLEAFAAASLSTGARPVFISLPHRRQQGEAPPDATYPKALQETAAKLGIPLLSVGGLSGDEEGNDKFFLDPVHLTPEGNQLLGDTLARELREEGLWPER